MRQGNVQQKGSHWYPKLCHTRMLQYRSEHGLYIYLFSFDRIGFSFFHRFCTCRCSRGRIPWSVCFLRCNGGCILLFGKRNLTEYPCFIMIRRILNCATTFFSMHFFIHVLCFDGSPILTQRDTSVGYKGDQTLHTVKRGSVLRPKYGAAVSVSVSIVMIEGVGTTTSKFYSYQLHVRDDCQGYISKIICIV